MNSDQSQPITFGNLVAYLDIATTKDNLQWETTTDESEMRTTVNGGKIWFARYPEIPPGTFSPDATIGRFAITLRDYADRVLIRSYPRHMDDNIAASELFWKIKRKLANLDNSFKTVIDDLKNKAGQ